MLKAPLVILNRALSRPQLALQGFSLPGSCLPRLLSFLSACPAMVPGLLQLLLRRGTFLLCFLQALLQPCFLLFQLLEGWCETNLKAQEVFLEAMAVSLHAFITGKSAQGLMHHVCTTVSI